MAYWLSMPVVIPVLAIAIVATKFIFLLVWPFYAFRMIARDSGYIVALFILMVGGFPLVVMLIGIWKVFTGELALF